MINSFIIWKNENCDIFYFHTYQNYVIKFHQLIFVQSAILLYDEPILNIVQIFVTAAYSFGAVFL